MITRLSASLLIAASALLPASCPAAPPAPAVRTISTSYTINNRSSLVTVKSEAGKVLLTRKAATPTLRAVLVKEAAASTGLPHPLLFTLEDATGLRLWSAPIPTGHGMHSAKFVWKAVDGAGGGMKFTFAFSTERQPGTAASAAEGNSPDGPIFTCVIGASNNIISMNAGDKTDQINMTAVPNGATLTSSDGTNATVHVTPAGDTLEINGTTIRLERVKRDGKDYILFPWNGHKVFVESNCGFSLTGDGDLTVNGPAKTAKK